MAEQDNESRSSLSSDGAELSIGDDSVSPSSDDSADMKDLTTASDLEDFSTRNNVAASHGTNAPDMPAKTFPFLKLPLELRMRVYYYVFHLECIKYFEFRTDGKEVDLRLLQTCCQIYEEAQYEIFKWNKFQFLDFLWSDPFADRPLLPAQKSAIRSISVTFGTMFWYDFPDLCTSFCKFISDFKGLRTAHIHVPQCSGNSVFNFQDGEDDWIGGITILQTLGLVHWDGVMIRPEGGETCVEIQGLLRLRIGHGQGTLGDPEYDGVSGNELRLLFRSHCLSWQTDQVELNL